MTTMDDAFNLFNQRWPKYSMERPDFDELLQDIFCRDYTQKAESVLQALGIKGFVDMLQAILEREADEIEFALQNEIQRHRELMRLGDAAPKEYTPFGFCMAYSPVLHNNIIKASKHYDESDDEMRRMIDKYITRHYDEIFALLDEGIDKHFARRLDEVGYYTR